jgi:hypothetical protein
MMERYGKKEQVMTLFWLDELSTFVVSSSSFKQQYCAAFNL